MAAPDAVGDEHDVVVVSVSWTGERSAQVQGTSLLGRHSVVRGHGEEDEQEEVKKQAQRREDREEEK